MGVEIQDMETHLSDCWILHSLHSFLSFQSFPLVDSCSLIGVLGAVPLSVLLWMIGLMMLLV